MDWSFFFLMFTFCVFFPFLCPATVDVPFPPNTSVPLLKAGLNAVALYLGVNGSFAPGAVASATDLLDALVYTTVEGTDSNPLDILSLGKPVFYGAER